MFWLPSTSLRLASTKHNMSSIHPLLSISAAEIETARDVILTFHDKDVISFREVFIQEPRKAELSRYLDAEHSGKLSSASASPSRLAKCQYDMIGADKIPYYHEATIDLKAGRVLEHEVIGKGSQPALTLYVATLGAMDEHNAETF
jgi:primary-amine oxidase